MNFRVAMLNMEQDHKRWDLRRELLIEQLAVIDPDVFAMNEVCIPRQTARWIQKTMRERYGRDYALVQQNRVNGLSVVEGEGLLTRLPIIETGNLDYRTRDMVALVARVRAGVRRGDRIARAARHRDAAGVGVLDDRHRGFVEVVRGAQGGIGVDVVVVRHLLALQLGGLGDAAAGGLDVERRLLVGVLAVAQAG